MMNRSKKIDTFLPFLTLVLAIVLYAAMLAAFVRYVLPHRERIEPPIHAAAAYMNKWNVEYEAQTLDGNAFAGDGLIAPTNLHLMSYTLSPDLSNDVFLLSDCERSDPPRQMGEIDPLTAAVSAAATVGIIGGADGPTALYVSAPQKNLHTAVSSLHFAPRVETGWRVTFRKRESEPITLELID